MDVPEQSMVLDLCCGIGRHSVLLAEKGFRVVGVDLSPEYIIRARELVKARAVSEKVEFKVGDMREIKAVLKSYKGRFNAVLNLLRSGITMRKQILMFCLSFSTLPLHTES